MPNRLGNWSQTWAMLWQCSKNIKTNKDYNPPYNSPPPITPPHPHPHLSSPDPSLPLDLIPGTQHFKTCCRTLLLLLHYLLSTVTIKPMTTPFSTWLDHLSPFTYHLLYASILESIMVDRHSVPYPTSLPMTLSPNSLSSSEFTQPFIPFSPGPPGAWQVPLTPARPLVLGNLLPSSPSSSASSRHKNFPLTFYMLRDSIKPSSSSLSPSFFCSQKVND